MSLSNITDGAIGRLHLSSHSVAWIQVAHMSSVTRIYPVEQVVRTLRHRQASCPQGWVHLAFNIFRYLVHTQTMAPLNAGPQFFLRVDRCWDVRAS